MNLQELADTPSERIRSGYYVENVFYGCRINQAKARAAWLSTLYGRSVIIVYVPDSDDRLVKGDVVYRVTGTLCERTGESDNW